MIPGYCALCREQEIEDYGTILNTADSRHQEACVKAGCRHPAVYDWPEEEIEQQEQEESNGG
jgi:hypothetical protein